MNPETERLACPADSREPVITLALAAATDCEADAARPAWFRRKPTSVSPQPAAEDVETDTRESRRHGQTRSAERRSRTVRGERFGIVVTNADALAASWPQRLRRWLIGFAGMGYGVSLLIHAVALTVLSLLMIRGMIGDDAVSTLVSVGEEEHLQFEELIVPSVELDAASDDLLEQQLQPVVSPAELTAPPLNLDESLAKALGQQDGGELPGSGGQLQFSMPKSGKAVRKGSFTAWTVPEDPKPGESYLIIIQIQLPSATRRYPRSDLSGMVIGTDGYEQVIPESAAGYLPVHDGMTQLVVKVPGAYALVRDSIRIESKLLKEKQSLEIVF